jgi:polysaccharide export outer membrane protein
LFYHFPSRRYGLTSFFVPLLLMMMLTACNGGPRITAGELPPDVVSVEDIILERYEIGVGDSLTVSVWRNPDLSAQVVVLPDGNISVPLVGDVRAAGATTQALAEQISSALNEFIREPEVTVSVTAAASSQYLQRVRITGAVNSALSIDYRRGLTVLDVVLLAGGLSPYANGNKATLFRRQGEELKVYRIKLEDILAKGRLETNYPVMPSDVITVPEKSF